MIYKKIQEILQLKSVINHDELLSEIYTHVSEQPKNWESVVADLVSLYLENKKNTENLTSLTTGFYYLFSQGLTWEKLQTYEVYKNIARTEKTPLLNVELFSIRFLFKDAFRDYFIPELENNSETLKAMFYKIFSCGLVEDADLEKIGTLLDMPKNKENLTTLMQSTMSFDQMETICKVFKISPWVIIPKRKTPDIETLWPTLVWNNELRVEKYNITKTGFSHKEEFFGNNIELWNTLHTEKTSSVDIHSRIAFAGAALSSDHYYSKFLRDLNIHKINLSCEDYLINPKERKSLKERLLEKGKLTTVNKFEKTQNLPTNLSNIITSLPAKPGLITSKKAFLKQWLKGKESDINYTDILVSILQTKGKFPKRPDLMLCYFPLKPEFLDKDAEYWKTEKLNNYDGHTIQLSEYRTEAANHSFVNFLNYVRSKGINWEFKNKDGKTLLSETIVKTMQLPMEYYLVKLGEPGGTIANAFKNISNEDKMKIFTDIKSNWSTIWNDSVNREHEGVIINTPFKKSSLIFNMLQTLSSIGVEEQLVLSEDFFDKSWKEIKNILNKFSNDDKNAKEALIKFVELEMLFLDKSLENKENTVPKKTKKI